jgi:hypothetical protein
MNRPSPLVFLSICAVVDFVFGYIKWHTVAAGPVAVVGGLALTALLVWVSEHLGMATVNHAPR